MSLTFVFCILHLFALTIAAPSFLNLTAISVANGESTLECWQLSDPFAVSNQAGTAGAAVKQLGNVTNATYSILPAKFDGGLHRAPAVQYAFLPVPVPAHDHDHDTLVPKLVLTTLPIQIRCLPLRPSAHHLTHFEAQGLGSRRKTWSDFRGGHSRRERQGPHYQISQQPGNDGAANSHCRRPGARTPCSLRWSMPGV